MANRRKSQDGEADETEVGPMDERTFKAFLKKLDLAQANVEEKAAEVKTARSDLSGIWKDFKKQGGKNETMRDVMRLRSMDEGDLIQHEADRQRYADWMKLPIHTQPSLFGAAADQPEPAPAARKTRKKPDPTPTAGKPGWQGDRDFTETSSPLN